MWHLSTSLILNKVYGPDSTGNGIKASSDPFPHSFAKWKHISLSLHGCVDDLLRILSKLVFLLSNEFCVLLFKLMLVFSQLLAPGTFLSLHLKNKNKHQASFFSENKDHNCQQTINVNFCNDVGGESFNNITICVILKACNFLLSSLIC